MKAHTRTPIQILNEARDSITSINISTTEIITGSVDGYIRTYDLRKGQLRSDFLGHPVTSLQPTKDGSTILVGTLDSTLRLLDTTSGTLLNSFTGHANQSYRTKACFGFGEASVICGDEEGLVWSWDLVSGNPILSPSESKPPKVHAKVITWTEHHPLQNNEMVTASADGTVKIWRSAPQ